MGLIKAAGGAIGGVLADQWKEYIYCESMAPDVLVCKGRKRVSQRSSNTKGEPDILSRGTVIAVNEGQCMAVVDQGKVVEFCAEPGEFTYDGSPEPSIFCGSLGESIKETFRQIGRRFSFGGGAAGTSGSTTSTSRRSSATSTARPTRCPSAWWTRTSAWTSTSPSAATANTPIRSSTRSCSTPTSAETWRATTAARRSTDSSSPS